MPDTIPDHPNRKPKSLKGQLPTRIGLITLDTKHTGKPSAGNLHAGFDAAGTGTQLTVWLVRHSQRKRRATVRPNLQSMAPVLDPTNRNARPKDEKGTRDAFSPSEIRLSS